MFTLYKILFFSVSISCFERGLFPLLFLICRGEEWVSVSQRGYEVGVEVLA